MSDHRARTADAARLIVEELEAVCDREAEIRARARAAALRRRRLLAALEPMLADMPKDEADWLRERRTRATQSELLTQAREQKDKFGAILAWLARNTEHEVRVGEIAEHLRRSGFEDLKPSYVSDTLRRFERHGLVHKVRHGRYRVNEGHRDILAHQLRWLEAEMRQRKKADRAAVWRHVRGRG